MSGFGEMDKTNLEHREAYHTGQVQHTKFHMVCYIKEFRNSIVINTHYFTHLFKPVTIEKAMQKYVKILESIGNDPEQLVKKVGETRKKLLTTVTGQVQRTSVGEGGLL